MRGGLIYLYTYWNADTVVFANVQTKEITTSMS